jgi:hypothetical protein
MYPYPEIPRARIAELHQQAERDALAIAIRRARRARPDRSGPAMPARLARAVRRALALVLPATPDPATAGHPGPETSMYQGTGA